MNCSDDKEQEKGTARLVKRAQPKDSTVSSSDYVYSISGNSIGKQSSSYSLGTCIPKLSSTTA
jgi:hypothetical protein